MVKCELCGADEFLPFTCPYCSRSFCAEHRLPESHRCERRWMARPPRLAEELAQSRVEFRGERVVTPPRAGVLSTLREHLPSRHEMRDLTIAWLALSAAVVAGHWFSPLIIIWLPISMVTVGLGFALHELFHKWVAQHFGYWAEFRMWTWGLLLAILLGFLTGGRFIYAMPGATHIMPPLGAYGFEVVRRREVGLISLAGPLLNIALAAIFWPLQGSPGLLGVAGHVGFRINLWLAGFNLIPLGELDGRKIMAWSVPVWALTALPAWALLFIT